jgi:hypothetical protein
MSRSLIWYNLSYYAKTLRFIAPCLVFIVWHFSIHSQIPIPIWSQYHLAALTIFVFSNWIGTSFINSEDRTQQFITRLHIKNETVYHVSKIATILLIMIPFYAIMIFYPIVFGFFVRSLLFTEIVAVVAIHFLFSLMGASMSIFFNADFHNQKNILPLQALVMLLVIVPFGTIFNDNMFIGYAVNLLPPLNFFGERLHDLDSDIFVIDGNFGVFVLWSLGYSLVLITVYILMIRKKNKH